MTNQKEIVTWASINNWVPIVASGIMVATSFASLQIRLALIEQKVEFIAQSQQEMLELFKNTEQRYGEISLEVERLKAINGM